MSGEYASFLAGKRRTAARIGRTVDAGDIHPMLFDWQREVVRWAVHTGRAALFEDAGLGKTIQSVEWARLSADTSLVLAPLAVCAQTVREAAKVDVEATYVRSGEQVTGPGVWVTNYEMAERFDPAAFGAVVLDESSILANVDGKTRQRLTELLAGVPHRLACTATPMPNDIVELTNHAEFLGVASRPEMLAAYFVNDAKNWRLKGHAAGPMFDWMATWAIAMRRPSDLGYGDDGYLLPPLRIIPELLDVHLESPGQLFAVELGGVGGRAKVRRATLGARVARTAELVAAEPDEPWIIWAGLNDEATSITRELGDAAVNVEGSWSPEAKADALMAFAAGEIRALVTKIPIAGYGLNFQHCARQAFLGMNDCYDEETEVLTHVGWKTFGKVSLDDDLATVNPETQAMEWQAPSRIVWEHYAGPMLHFQGQKNFDLLVTPNHRLFVERCPIRFPSTSRGWELIYAQDVADRFRRQEYRMLSAPLASQGALPDVVKIPAFGRINARSRTISKIAADDFMRLAGWYLSEGYCRPVDSGERGRIVICQTEANADNRAEIISLMSRIGLAVNARTKDITGYSLNLAAYLIDQFGSGSHEKRIPRWVKDLHPDLLAILRDTMLKGDGGHRHGGTPQGNYYATVSPTLADDFQEIALKTGIRASVHYRPSRDNRYSDRGIFHVTLAWQNLRPTIHRAPEVVQYDGMIGCATVPNHTLIVRRNGIPVVSGNSWQGFYQAIRRSYRYGQTREVHAHLVLSELEGQIAANVARKETEADVAIERLVAAMRRAWVGQRGAA